MFIPEADTIWYDGFAYARGTIEIDLYGCADGCRERLIARLGLEEYLYGLGEVPASWPREALRAQAVAARSYATYGIRRYGVRSECACHLTDGAGDQTYIGYDRESGRDGGRWVAAVDATRGRAVTYRDRVIQAFYAASDGGHSENVEDVWHAGNPAFAIPWLTGVCDPGESTAANPWTAWTRTFDRGTLSSRLAPYSGSIGTVTSFDRIQRGASGTDRHAPAARLCGEGHDHGDAAARRSGAPRRPRLDQRRPDHLRADPREVRRPDVRTRSALHRPHRREGRDAATLHRGGLYRNGGLGLTVWLRGDIDDEYRVVGTGAGVLGVPTTQVADLSGRARVCSRCKVARFVGGRIYWKAAVGANALWGRVLRTYLDEGAVRSRLGFPLSRVIHRSGGGTRARFEHGSIRCPKGSSCQAIVS